MTFSNNEVIRQLEMCKNALQDACDEAEGAQLQHMTVVIAALRVEIGAIEKKNLEDEDYVPISEAFRRNTALGKKFQDDLEQVKNGFQSACAIASALDKVVNIVKAFV